MKGFIDTALKIFNKEKTNALLVQAIVVVIILLKIKLIENISVGELNKSLIIVPVFGRWICSVGLFLCPLDSSLQQKPVNVVISTIIAIIVAIVFWFIKGIGIFMVIFGAGILFSLLIRIKFGNNTLSSARGITEITEIATLIFLNIIFSRV